MSMLSERAVLAALHYGMWSGQITDKEVSDEAARNHGADESDGKAGRYQKQLIHTRYLSRVGQHASKARATHNLLTSPWMDGGVRILAVLGFQNYTETMRLARLGYEAAVNQFCNDLEPNFIPEAEKRLGKMFNRDDYPSAESIKAKFYFETEILPVEEAGDFRAQLSNDSVKNVTKSIEKNIERRVQGALNDTYLRIIAVTEKMVERLHAYKPPTNGTPGENMFRDSLVWNIKELAELIPALNITGDQRLEQLQKRLLEDLVEHPPEILRDNDKVRAQTAAKAEKILAKARSYLA